MLVLTAVGASAVALRHLLLPDADLALVAFQFKRSGKPRAVMVINPPDGSPPRNSQNLKRRHGLPRSSYPILHVYYSLHSQSLTGFLFPPERPLGRGGMLPSPLV